MNNHNIDRILSPGSRMYYRITNADGKQWLMPARNMRVAMALYQPGSRNGRMLKRWLPRLHRLPGVTRALHAEPMKVDLAPALRGQIARAFGVDDFEWSLFGGTPGTRQKITIQVSMARKILGYCKVSYEHVIYDLFRREAEILSSLRQCDILTVPASLYVGECDGMYMFVQSTEKTLESTVAQSVDDSVIAFCEVMANRTSVKCFLDDTDFGKDIAYMETILDAFRECDIPVLQKGVGLLRKKYEGEHAYSFSHGDFTPWNTYVCVGDGILHAFDFEYAQRSMPPFIDLVHYALQIGILNLKLTDAEVLMGMLNGIGLSLRAKGHDVDINTLTIAYLTHILAFYSRLFDGHFPHDDNGYVVWTSLLKRLVKYYE